jgi:tetratricopeptide (TPR) repeat protein
VADKRRFRIAFSFAGEKRNFVAKVADILAKMFTKEAILYDKYHEAEFARYDLGIYLPKLYREEADLIVAVICPNYDDKLWTGWEWMAIHAQLTKPEGRKIVLCRFEHGRVAGLHENAGFIELDHKTPAEAVILILERLALNEGKPRDHYKKSIATTAESPTAITPNNLPRLHSFFGRTDELRKIADALSPKTRTWGVLIDGLGGMGKTSLAIRAGELAPTGQFRHVFFLSSQDRRMTSEGVRKLSDFVVPGYLDMLNEIARLLKQPDLAKQPETERARLLIDALAPAQALLILDNLEQLPKDQRDRLFEFLSQLPPGCKAIATSRRRTDVDARIIRLGKLDQDAALVLIDELAKDRPLLARTTAEERMNLYEETGGNPLLIRWVAGQLGKGQCRNIASALNFLRSTPADNDPLEFIFGDLLKTFTENEIKVLAALTYLTQLAEVKPIAEVAAITSPAAEVALGDLSIRALVAPDEEEKTFSLVPMVADFLRRTRPEVVKEIGIHLADRAAWIIAENGWRKYDRFPELDREWPMLAPALTLFFDGPDDRLQRACAGLARYLYTRGRWDELLSLSKEAEQHAVTAMNFEEAGWRAYQAGYIHFQRQQVSELQECEDRASRHWGRQDTQEREKAAAIRLRGLLHRLKTEYPEAIADFKKALEMDRSVNPVSRDVYKDLSNLAKVEYVAGNHVAAEGHGMEAERVAQAVDVAQGAATHASDQAAVALRREDWTDAEILARQALLLSENLGRIDFIASNCRRLAQALVRQGKTTEALIHARRAVEIYTQLYTRPGSPRFERALTTLRECEQK